MGWVERALESLAGIAESVEYRLESPTGEFFTVSASEFSSHFTESFQRSPFPNKVTSMPMITSKQQTNGPKMKEMEMATSSRS